MNPIFRHLALALIPVGFAVFTARLADDVQPQDAAKPVRWVSVPDLPRELAILDSVFWEPLDTEGLRELIREKPRLVAGKSILEIGTGSGLIALCCFEAGAASVTATDINPHAIQCAAENARRLGRAVEFRLVAAGGSEDSSAYSVILPNERFDLIVSNPPWVDATPAEWSEYALYDPSFQLLRSILVDCRQHLTPEGRILLAYGCDKAIQAARKLAAELNMKVLILDERDPDSLPDVFLPGMTLGILPQ